MASSVIAADGTVEIADGSGAILYRVRESNETYRVTSANEQLMSRVKVKEDKLNVYDSEDKRVFHGKEKDDEFKVKDESDEQIWKIKGATSLREASTLSTPMPLLSRLVLWGVWYGAKTKER